MLQSTTLFAMLLGTGLLQAQSQWRPAFNLPRQVEPTEIQTASAIEQQQHPAMPHKNPALEQTPTITVQPATQDAQPQVAETPEAAKAKEAAALKELGTAVEKLGKNLTVLTGDEEIKLILGGVVSADFYYNHARPLAPGIPFFLTPRSPFGFNQDTFDANARATTLFGLVKGPKVCDFETGALVAVCLFNDALIVDRYGILPIQAWGELKNDDWRFAAGLQFDVFSPLNPNMLTFSLLGGSGNAGVGFPGQARVERYLHPSCNEQITLTVALSEPVSTTVNNQLALNEDNGFPNLEARAAWAYGPLTGEGVDKKRPLEVGVSGLLGQIRTTQAATRVVADVWGLAADVRWAITPCYGVQGEIFAGQTLGSYTAGILQNTNVSTFAGVHAAGGWVEGYYYLVPEKLHAHVGYGIDDPLDGDLALGQPVRNETYFANLIWQATKHIRVGGELTYRRTEYTLLRNNDGMGFQTQVQWKF